MSSVANFVYIFAVRPFNTKLYNGLEFFNEISIMTFSYSTILFSDFSPESELKIDMGWKGTLLFFSTLFLNVAVIVFLALEKIYKAMKNLWENRNKMKKNDYPRKDL